jgi:hypothetical protein
MTPRCDERWADADGANEGGLDMKNLLAFRQCDLFCFVVGAWDSQFTFQFSVPFSLDLRFGNIIRRASTRRYINIHTVLYR